MQRQVGRTRVEAAASAEYPDGTQCYRREFGPSSHHLWFAAELAWHSVGEHDAGIHSVPGELLGCHEYRCEAVTRTDSDIRPGLSVFPTQ